MHSDLSLSLGAAARLASMKRVTWPSFWMEIDPRFCSSVTSRSGKYLSREFIPLANCESEKQRHWCAEPFPARRQLAHAICREFLLGMLGWSLAALKAEKGKRNVPKEDSVCVIVRNQVGTVQDA